MKVSLRKNKILIIIIGVLIIIALNFYQNEFKGFFYSLSEPVQKLLWQKSQKLSNFFRAISEAENLKKELDNLKLENQKLLSEIVLFNRLKEENESLREVLKIGLQKDFELNLAQVIGKDISQDTFFIDKGSEDGIAEGLAVISSSKALFGKIGKVYKNHSQVILISNKASNISVKIGDKEIEGVLRGEGNFKILLGLIPLDKEIKVGDLLYTTGREGIIPKNLLVGKINTILKNDIEPYQQAEILPFFEIGDLKVVFVILSF